MTTYAFASCILMGLVALPFLAGVVTLALAGDNDRQEKLGFGIACLGLAQALGYAAYYAAGGRVPDLVRAVANLLG